MLSQGHVINPYNALVNKIETFGLVDGPGVRVVVFLQGCNMRCKYCHNPETWALKSSEAKEYSANDLLSFCWRYHTYWGKDMCNGGVTFSGGEPLLQLDFLIEFAKLAKEKGISIAIDTCGQPFKSDKEYLKKFDMLAELVDLFIVDIKCYNEELHKKLTGHSNKNILEMISHLNTLNKKMWIRHVLVPNLTDSEEDLINIRKFIEPLNSIHKVEILPYHNLALFKYEKLGIENPLKDAKLPTDEEIKRAENLIGTKRN